MSGAGHGAEPMARQWRGACRARNALQNPRVVWPSAALNKPSIRAGHGSKWRGAQEAGTPAVVLGTSGKADRIAPCRLGTSWPPAASVRGRETASPTSVPAAPMQQNQSNCPCHAKHPCAWPPRWPGPLGELHTVSTQLWPGMLSPRGEKASGELNSLYLCVTTAAFNSLE